MCMFTIHYRHAALNNDVKRAKKNSEIMWHRSDIWGGKEGGDGNNKLKLHSREIRTN